MTNTAKSETKLEMKTKLSKILQYETEMRRMQKTIDELQAIKDPLPSPVRATVATLQIPHCDNNAIDYDQGRNSKKENGGTLVAGIIRRTRKSPATDSSSETGDGDNSCDGFCHLANRGMGSGGGGGDDHDDGGNDGVAAMDRNYGYNNRKQELMLVKSSNIAVTTFIGTNLTTNPYLLFYKTMGRLICNHGEDRELLLDLHRNRKKCGAEPFTNQQL